MGAEWRESLRSVRNSSGRMVRLTAPFLAASGAFALMSYGVSRFVPEDPASLDISKVRPLTLEATCSPPHVGFPSVIIDRNHYDLAVELKELNLQQDLWSRFVDLDTKAIVTHYQPLADKSVPYSKKLHDAVTERDKKISFTQNQRLRVLLYDGSFGDENNLNSSRLIAAADMTFRPCF